MNLAASLDKSARPANLTGVRILTADTKGQDNMTTGKQAVAAIKVAIVEEIRVRLSYVEGRGHEVVRPLLLDSEGDAVFIAGGEMRKLSQIESVELLWIQEQQ